MAQTGSYGISPQRSLTWVALACIAFLILHVLLVSLGWYGNDDINYARWAAFYAREGHLPVGVADHFAYRWLVIVLTGWGYKWFGVNDVVSAGLSLVSTILVTVMLYRYLQRHSGPWLVLLVFSLQYTVVFYAHRLLPDSTVMMLGFAAYLVYRDGPLRVQAGLLAALALFLAFLAKETVVLMVPVWLGLVVTDLVRKRAGAFWKGFFGAGVLLLAAYLWYFHATTGDALQRWHVLQRSSYYNECSYDQLPAVDTWKRIGYGLWLAWLRNGDLLVLAPALVAWFYRGKIFVTEGAMHFFSSFPLWVLAANFMSISVRSYVPMCPDPRHFLFILPLAAYGTGSILLAYRKDPQRFPALPVVMGLLAVVAFAGGVGEMRWLYLGWAAWLVGARWWKGRAGWPMGWLAGVVVLLLLRPALDFVRETYPAYKPRKALLKEMAGRDFMPGLVWTTTDFDAELGEYMLGFTGKPFRFAKVTKAEGVATYLLTDAVQDRDLVEGLGQKGLRPLLEEGPAAVYLIDTRDAQQWVLENVPK